MGALAGASVVAPHVERSLAGLALTGPGAQGTEAAEDLRAPQPGGRRHETERKVSFEGAPGTWALVQSLISHLIKFLDVSFMVFCLSAAGRAIPLEQRGETVGIVFS